MSAITSQGTHHYIDFARCHMHSREDLLAMAKWASCRGGMWAWAPWTHCLSHLLLLILNDIESSGEKHWYCGCSHNLLNVVSHERKSSWTGLSLHNGSDVPSLSFFGWVRCCPTAHIGRAPLLPSTALLLSEPFPAAAQGCQESCPHLLSTDLYELFLLFLTCC